MVAYLFAGQGSQYIGMGRDLYEAFAESKAVFDSADKVLGFSLSKLCFEGPQEELTRTQNCQPAILTMSIACWKAFISAAKPPCLSGRRACLTGRQASHQAASYAAGLSLGEYSALVAAEAMSFEDAVYLVQRRGEFMEEEALKRPGRMASVLGLNLEVVADICRQANTEIANINSPEQIVISGGPKEIEAARKLAEERQAKRVILLEVSGAFHSSFMKGASLKLAAELEKIKIDAPKVAVVSNVNAKAVTSVSEIKENLIKQLFTSVLWEDSMKFILSKGVMNFVEFGPGRVLKGLMRRIEPAAQVKNIEKKEDVQSWLNGNW